MIEVRVDGTGGLQDLNSAEIGACVSGTGDPVSGLHAVAALVQEKDRR